MESFDLSEVFDKIAAKKNDDPAVTAKIRRLSDYTDCSLVPEKNMQDSLDAWVKDNRESTLDYFKSMVDKGEKYAVYALVDSSKDKMEWTDAEGNVRYLKRKEE